MDRLQEMGLVGDVLSVAHGLVEDHHRVREGAGPLDREHAGDGELRLPQFLRGLGAVLLRAGPAGEEGSAGGAPRARRGLGRRGSLGRGPEEGQGERHGKAA